MRSSRSPSTQQVLDVGKGSVELLEQALGCTLAEARAIFGRRDRAARVPGTNPEPATKKPPPQATRERGRLEKPAGLQGIPKSG